MWAETSFGKAVREHIDNGLKVFPLHGIDDSLKCTCGESPCGRDNKNAGKHPYSNTVPHGLLDATESFEHAAELFEYRTDLNIGVATGKQSGIVVVDVDNKNNNRGDESLVKIQDLFGTLPTTMCLTTGNGYHLIFDYPEGGLKSSGNSYGINFQDIDIRGDGGYIVIYPSRHYTGRYYQPDTNSAIADLPAMHLEYLKLDRSKKNGGEDKIDRQQRCGNNSEWTEVQIGEALTFLDPDITYSDWIAAGMGLHKEGFPLDLWDRWSSGGQKYKGIKDLDFHWRSFKRSGERTIGTIIDWAMTQGWKPQGDRELRATNEEANIATAPLVKNILKKRGIDIEMPAKYTSVKDIVEGVPLPISATSVKSVDISDSIITPPISTVSLQEFANIQQQLSPDTNKQFTGKFCFNPMNLPGGIGDTVRHIVRTSIYEQPELAMMNTLAFLGAVFGRKYASPRDTRTNVYMVGIADTGAGKEHSVRIIEKIALHAGLMSHVGANSVRSDIGLLKALMKNSSVLLQIDEFGMLMQAMTDPRAPFHLRSISSIITKLYSKSSGVYKHGEVGDERQKELIIANPNLCVFGVTTEESYIPALKRSAINSGELNRFIVIPSRQQPMPKRQISSMELPQDLIDWWARFSPGGAGKRSIGELVNSASIVPAAKVVDWEECDDMQYGVLCKQSAIRNGDGDTKALWTRLYENTIKIAMIFAIARDPDAPKIITDDMDYAYSIVDSSIQYMNYLALDHMVENSQEKMHNDVMRAIKASGEKGVSRAELLRMFRTIRKRDLDDLIATYLEEDSVSVARVVPKSGRPSIIYFSLDTDSRKRAKIEPNAGRAMVA